MATGILNEATEKNIGEMIASRADRGWALYPTKRQLITKRPASEDTYTVPSCSGRGAYTVHYGGVEDCECTAFGVGLRGRKVP